MANQEMVDQLEPWSDLNSNIVMITGASSGLGLQICLDLAKAGCRIVAAARRLHRLNSLCEQINKFDVPLGGPRGGFCRALAVELDITADSTLVEASVDKAWNAFGNIDVLINNAGVRGKVKSSLELSEEEWDYEVKTNLKGSWMVSKYIGAHMRNTHRGGSIINISSIVGLNRVFVPGDVAYSSSKAALNSMTKVMALELGDYKIKVNSIAAGLFNSEITQKLFQKKWLENVMKKSVPLATTDASTDSAFSILALIRYLIHESSTYISGNIFIVDSGYSLPAFPILSSL